MGLTEKRSLYSRCIRCGRTYDGVLYRCPSCGYLTRIEYDGVEWRLDKKLPSMWRYSALLPPVRARVSYGEGYTPLRRIGGIPVKMESINPTKSYADRASSLLVSVEQPSSAKLSYVSDFTLSLAYYMRGRAARIEVYADPSGVELEDIILLDRMGARIVFSGSTSSLESFYENPLVIEGLKTIAYEIAESSPKEDEILVPAETGLLAYSIGKGLEEAVEMGVSREYGLVAVTLKGSKPPEILRYSRYPVKVVEVSSEETMEALLALYRSGVHVRPLAATSYAAALSRGGIAIITSSSKSAIPLKPRGSSLHSIILEVLGRSGESTAYEIWRMLGGSYSLRGVYKALETLEAQGLVSSAYALKGSRKIKLYAARSS